MTVKSSAVLLAFATLSVGTVAVATRMAQPYLVVGVLVALLLIVHAALSRSWLIPVWAAVSVLCVLGGLHGGYAYFLVIPLAFGVIATGGGGREPRAHAGTPEPQRNSGHWRVLLFLTTLVLQTVAISLFADTPWFPVISLILVITMGLLTFVLVKRSDPATVANQLEAAGLLTAVIFLSFVSTRLSTVGAGTWTKVFDQSTWLNPNSLGAFFLLCSSLPVARWAKNGFSWRTAISAAILVGACLCTFSRSSLLGLLAILVVTVLRRRRLILPVGAAATYLAIWTPQALADRVIYTFQGGQLDNSSNTRLLLWQAAWEIGADNPGFGVGLSQLGVKLGPLAVEKGIQFAHNSYLTMFAAFGLPMAVLSVLLVLGLVVKLVRRVRVPDSSAYVLAALAGTCGLAVASVFGEPLLTPAVTCTAVAVIANGVIERTNA